MKNKHNVTDILAYFQAKETAPLTFQTAAIEKAYAAQGPRQTLPIKVLSIIGGLLAAIAFFGFLLIAGFYQSGVALMSIGFLAIAMGLILSRKHDNILLDTMSVSSIIIGFILIGVGMAELDVSEKNIPLSLIILAVICLLLARSYMLSFVSTLVAHASIIAYIMVSEQHSLLPVYVALLGVAVCYVFLKEAKLVNSSTWARLYSPVKIALIFMFISGLIFMRDAFINLAHPYLMLAPSIICMLLILYVTHLILQRLGATRTSTIGLTYLLTVLTLIPTAVTPGIAGALLLLLLAFFTNYKTAFVVAAISLLYFIGQCYYDLEFTLLTKSIVLFASGVFFLILYLFIAKRHD